MIFWRKTKINWPFWVFGLIAIGIIVSVSFLIFNLLHQNLQKENSNLAVDINQKAEQVKQAVALNYKNSLNNLIVVVKKIENTSEIKSEVQKIFLDIRVPQEYLDAHLKAWLAIDKLSETNFKTDVLQILQQLTDQVK